MLRRCKAKSTNQEVQNFNILLMQHFYDRKIDFEKCRTNENIAVKHIERRNVPMQGNAASIENV